jgi:hypothetical protein
VPQPRFRSVEVILLKRYAVHPRTPEMLVQVNDVYKDKW